jgi:membrane-bound ClpP family serine protease
MVFPSLGLLSLTSAGLFFYSYILLYGHNPSLTPILLLINVFSVPAVIVYSTRLVGSSPAALKKKLDGSSYFGLSTGVTPGETGITQSPLRPVGKARFSAGYFDVTAQRNYIETGRNVVVVSVKKNTIVVDEYKQDS